MAAVVGFYTKALSGPYEGEWLLNGEGRGALIVSPVEGLEMRVFESDHAPASLNPLVCEAVEAERRAYRQRIASSVMGAA